MIKNIWVPLLKSLAKSRSDLNLYLGIQTNVFAAPHCGSSAWCFSDHTGWGELCFSCCSHCFQRVERGRSGAEASCPVLQGNVLRCPMKWDLWPFPVVGSHQGEAQAGLVFSSLLAVRCGSWQVSLVFFQGERSSAPFWLPGCKDAKAEPKHLQWTSGFAVQDMTVA